MKQVAVVILNWNGVKLLEQFLPSVIRFSPQATVYVADNASEDLSVELIRVKFPMVKLIRNTENFGFAQGYNEALRFVEEEIYALVNSDVEVTDGWLTPMLDLFAQNPDVSVIQPKILDYKNKTRFEYAGAAGGFIDRYGFPFCRGRLFSTLEDDIGQYDDVSPIFWASGACFLVRKEVFRELGGFDSRFFAHQEEIDFCWRAFNRNHQAWYCGTSTVYHLGGATLEAENPRKTYLNFRNSLMMITKNVRRRNLFGIVLTRLCLDGVAGIRFLLQGKWNHTAAIIKAHYAFYGLFSEMYESRGIFQHVRFYKVRSVVWLYFFKRKKTFPSLF